LHFQKNNLLPFLFFFYIFKYNLFFNFLFAYFELSFPDKKIFFFLFADFIKNPQNFFFPRGIFSLLKSRENTSVKFLFGIFFEIFFFLFEKYQDKLSIKMSEIYKNK
jgi:hypothetical protein